MKHSSQINYTLDKNINGKSSFSQLNTAIIYGGIQQIKIGLTKKLVMLLLPMFFFISGFTQQNLALDFDGINDVASVPHYDAIHFAASENFSIECWVKIPAADQVNSTYRYNTILQKGSGNYPYSLGIFNQKAAPSYQRGIVYAYRSDGANVSICISKKRIDDNQFHHLAFVRNAGTLYLYIDGLLDNTGYDIAGSSLNYGDLYIGNDASAAHANLSGLVDEIRIWKIPLTASQIQYSMNCKLTGNEINLVGYYNFDNPSAVAGGNNGGLNYIADDLGNGHTGTLSSFSLSGETSNWINGDPAFNPTFLIYFDADGDSYGDANAYIEVNSCSAWPAGYVTDNTDCNNTDPAIHPGATEICNGIDDNCNGEIDEGIEKPAYYADSDGDGYGNAGVSVQACSKPDGYVIDYTDCNDANASIHPNAPEICGNNFDDDCDGLIDEGCISFDADGDGYTFKDGDCNDYDANIHPGVTEICGNDIDENCNGQINETCLPAISITDSKITEGDMLSSFITFTVSLDHPSADTVWVNLISSDITATARGDYRPDAGVIKFLPGKTSKKITALIFGDMVPEKSETFKVILSNPVNAIIADSVGVGTILNDDKLISVDDTPDKINTEDLVAAFTNSAIKIWPNPAISLLNVQIAEPFKQSVTIQLTDIAGKTVKQWKLLLQSKQSVHQLNIGGLFTGAYILVIQDNNGNKTTQKIIINH